MLVQHGTRDRTVPFAHGEQLAAAARRGEMMRYACGHNDCPWERMMEDLLGFLDRQGVVPAGNPPRAKGVG